MTINYFNDMNVYFHMKNHYRRLRNVKSTVDNRISQIYVKPVSSSQSERCLSVFEDERHTKNCPHLPNHSSSIKKHSCFSSEARSDTSLCSNSRPSTRRNPRELPYQTFASRSSSLGPSLRKFTISNRQNRNKKNIVKTTVSDNDKDDIGNESGETKGREFLVEGLQLNESQENSPENTNRSNKTTSSERSERKRQSASEHEYLQFLLRITEDIIMNDYFTKKDINRVLENHIEANSQRLNMDKMRAHVSRLCRELNIEYPNFVVSDDDIGNMFSHSPEPNLNLTNCECANMRNLSFGKTTTLELESQSAGFDDQLSYMEETFLRLNHSLGRVTECTEPTESLNTIDENKMPSNITVGSYDVEIALPGLENEKEEEEKLEESISEKEMRNRKKINNTPRTSPRTETITIPRLCLVTPEGSSTNIIKDQFVENDKSNFTTGRNTYSVDFESNRTLVISLNSDNNRNSIQETPKSTSRSSKPSQSTTRVKNSPSNLAINSADESEKIVLPNTPNLILENDTERLFKSPQSSENSSPKTYSVHNSADSSLNDPVSGLSSKHNSPKHLKDTPNKIRNHINCVDSPKSEKSKSESQENSVVKLILDGNLKNDDYILVNGPVYIFKALIDTNPKLVRIQSENVPEKVERETNVTPTLENVFEKPEKIRNPPLISPSSDVTLYSLKERLEDRFILDNFLLNSRLINEDYDLTPEREKDISNYHYLMADATTSVSNVTLSKNKHDKMSNLLLNDNYVLNKAKKYQQTDFGNVKNLDTYVNTCRELPEHDYIKHFGSSSKTFQGGRHIKIGNEPLALVNNAVENFANSDSSGRVEIARGLKRTRNAVDFGSADSSLRSEGEASSKN